MVNILILKASKKLRYAFLDPPYTPQEVFNFYNHFPANDFSFLQRDRTTLLRISLAHAYEVQNNTRLRLYNRL